MKLHHQNMSFALSVTYTKTTDKRIRGLWEKYLRNGSEVQECWMEAACGSWPPG